MKNFTFYLPEKQQNTYSQDSLSLNTATLSLEISLIKVYMIKKLVCFCL